MEKLTIELPMMYGDHHVVEVRNLLLALAGVQDVYASSCFQIVEIEYDAAEVNTDTIKDVLAKSGYTGELPLPVESGATADKRNGDPVYFRHTAVVEQAGPAVSFSQNLPYHGRPLWPCPSIGTLVDES
jgi:copper chaperone CopZ